MIERSAETRATHTANMAMPSVRRKRGQKILDSKLTHYPARGQVDSFRINAR